ncbi:biotin/lipoyl-binding protein [bacterium]|nr:biotin/lipoyl-binding protein [bacterium]
MVSRYLVPVLAILGVALGIKVMARNNREVVPAQPVAAPSVSPYADSLSGSGLTEASTENIEVSTPVSGLVTDVFVQVGDVVAAGAPLFRLDVRDLEATRDQRLAAITTAKSRLHELESRPRAEDIPPAEAAVGEARVQLEDAMAQLEFATSLADPGALSSEERTRRRFAVAAAKARLATAEANLQSVKAGAFPPEIETARASVAEAEAALHQLEVEIERHTVRSPIAGKILQRNIHPGEYAQSGALSSPLLLLGSTDVMHVRVDIDENDAWRFKEAASATACLRGNKSFSVPLTFVRAEPYVVPKKSLTGLSTERVDTRVLQVIYAFDSKAIPVHVGQMMDVYISENVTPNIESAQGANL